MEQRSQLSLLGAGPAHPGPPLGLVGGDICGDPATLPVLLAPAARGGGKVKGPPSLLHLDKHSLALRTV